MIEIQYWSLNEIIASVFISIGVLFNFFGCVGLVRLPDVYNRLQAATKCVTLGTCFILIGVLVFDGITSMGTKALLCMVFILLTSPTGAHALARGAHKFGIRLWSKSVIDKYWEDQGL